MQCNTMQYHAISCNIMQYHAMQCNTMQYHAIPYRTMQYHAIPCYIMQYHAIPCNTMQYHAIPCNTMQYHTIPCNTMQNYAIQCKTMQYPALLITADGAYHCPVGSIRLFLEPDFGFKNKEKSVWIRADCYFVRLLFIHPNTLKSIISNQYNPVYWGTSILRSSLLLRK